MEDSEIEHSLKRLISFNNISGIAVPVDQKDIEECVALVEHHENVRFNLAEVVFVGKKEIRRINKEYLHHDYVTDIITFSYVDNESELEGTLYCCAQKIAGQAKHYQVDWPAECFRVIFHGLLHLTGYNDAEEQERKRFRKREDFYLKKLDR